ncbi:MAG: formate dehydrogenase accessory protein FdhE [Pseudomonadota bacterium]
MSASTNQANATGNQANATDNQTNATGNHTSATGTIFSTSASTISIEQLEKKLRALKGKEYIPNALLELVARTALLQREAVKRVEVTLVEKDIASAEDHEEGDPLLERKYFPYDKTVTAQVFGALLGMFCAAGGELGTAAANLRGYMEEGKISIDAACTAVLRDDEGFFERWAERLPQAPSMIRFLALSSLMPSVEHVAQQLAKRHQSENLWPYSHCPICGSEPLMGRVMPSADGPDGDATGDTDACTQREDTCSFCRHTYVAAEEQCPFCLNRGPDAISVYTADNAPTWHLHVCTACRAYLKVVDYTADDSVSIPVLDDLETLALDILARQQDLKRTTPSAWGF